VLTVAVVPLPVTPLPDQSYTTLVFLLGSTDPAVAVAFTASPGNTAGGLAWQARVIAGGFLHPNGANARMATAETWKKDLKERKLICASSPFLRTAA